jgi:hypothetical protein
VDRAQRETDEGFFAASSVLIARSQTPHPLFGHLLPQGEKGRKGLPATRAWLSWPYRLKLLPWSNLPCRTALSHQRLRHCFGDEAAAQHFAGHAVIGIEHAGLAR